MVISYIIDKLKVLPSFRHSEVKQNAMHGRILFGPANNFIQGRNCGAMARRPQGTVDSPKGPNGMIIFLQDDIDDRMFGMQIRPV